MTVYSTLALLLLQAGGGSALPQLLFQVVLIFAIFYFVMIRPQQKQRKAHEERLRNLKRGDRVVTTGGIVGEVVHLKESVKDGAAQRTMEDEVTIKSAESRLIVERGRIARVINADGTASAAPQTK